MILIIDNYDSFVYNLARYVEKLGFEYVLKRNDKITIEEISELNPEAIILSPGPGKPKNAGICIEIIQKFGDIVPILGVCLGHQAIGEAYGSKTILAQKPIHGKSRLIEHDRNELFKGLESPITAGRYHSLVTDITQPNDLEIIARSKSGEIMAIKHKHHPVYGVQFHPESVLTPQGIQIINNFMIYSNNWHKTNNKN